MLQNAYLPVKESAGKARRTRNAELGMRSDVKRGSSERGMPNGKKRAHAKNAKGAKGKNRTRSAEPGMRNAE